jgi:hypothetical protein
MSALRSLSLATLAVLALGSAAADPERGIVTVAYDGKPQQVFPVTIQEIDGKIQPLPTRETHYLAPGKHSFRLAPVFDDWAKMQRGTNLRRGEDAAAVLEIDVEAGKRYVIGAKIEDRKSAEWKPVVLRVEDTGP